MFRHHHHLRRWAARVLLLWLLGLGASVANGCLAPVHLAPVAAAASPDEDPTATAQPSASPHCAPGTQGHPAKANCQDFCAKASVSVPNLKSALDDLQSQAVAILPGLTVQPARPVDAPAGGWVPSREGVLAPPIRIAFLRLTL